jgi:hypothetical protein
MKVTGLKKITQRMIVLWTLFCCLYSAPGLAITPGTDVFLPMVESGKEANNSQLRATVRAHNPETSPANVQFFLLKLNQTNPLPPVYNDTILPGETKRYNNAIEMMFGRTESGILRVVSDRRLVVSQRIYSMPPSKEAEESVEQLFAAVPANFAIGEGQKIKLLGGGRTVMSIDPMPGYPFSLVEITGGIAAVRVTALSEAGNTIAARDYTLREFEPQRHEITDLLPGGGADKMTFEVEVISGSGKVVVFGSELDKYKSVNEGDSAESKKVTIADAGASANKSSVSEASSAKTKAKEESGSETSKSAADELTLPYSGSNSSSSTLFSITQTGTGGAGKFRINNNNSEAGALLIDSNSRFPVAPPPTAPSIGASFGASSAIFARNTGGGPAGAFQITNASNTSHALKAETFGSGFALAAFSKGVESAGYFGISNISNPSPALRAETNGAGQAGSFKIVGAATTSDALYAETVGIGGNAIRGIHKGFTGSGGDFQIANFLNSAAALRAETKGPGSAGFFKIDKTSSSSSAVHAETNGDGGNAVRGIHNGKSGNAVAGIHNGKSGNAGDFYISNPDNTSAALRVVTEGSGPAIYAKANDDGLAANFIGVTRTYVLQITGGADLSEQFEVAVATAGGSEAQPEQIRPGSVVSIDPNNPGKLVISNRAYDRRVAGIISGAGGVRPGMLMSQSGSIADGSHPVALTGRVYCLADASYGPIKPGDLLTTSKTPGHAMRVISPAKAQGAIIGKAITGLKEGRGLVLVLVTLQ